MDLSKLEVKELLNLQSSVIEELKARNIVRTENNPVGDYAEWLVAKCLNLKLANNSSAGSPTVRLPVTLDRVPFLRIEGA